MRFYLGFNAKANVREVFRSSENPTELTHPGYNAVVGPFRTKRAAEYMRDRRYVQTVAQAEKESVKTPGKVG